MEIGMDIPVRGNFGMDIPVRGNSVWDTPLYILKIRHWTVFYSD